jgi:hypothetical protein
MNVVNRAVLGVKALCQEQRRRKRNNRWLMNAEWRWCRDIRLASGFDVRAGRVVVGGVNPSTALLCPDSNAWIPSPSLRAHRA